MKNVVDQILNIVHPANLFVPVRVSVVDNNQDAYVGTISIRDIPGDHHQRTGVTMINISTHRTGL